MSVHLPDVIKRYVPDAVIGTIESGGESASIPASGVSAAAPFAAPVGGGNCSHRFYQKYIFLFAFVIVLAV